MNYDKMSHPNCSSCNHWPTRWKELVAQRLIVPGGIYRNNTTGLLFRNLKQPMGHYVGYESISGSRYYWALTDRTAMAKGVLVDHLWNNTRLSIVSWWLAKLKLWWHNRGKQ